MYARDKMGLCRFYPFMYGNKQINRKIKIKELADNVILLQTSRSFIPKT